MSSSSRKLYFQYIKDHWLLYGTGTAWMMITSTTEVLSPKFVQWCLDTVTVANAKEKIPSWFWHDDPTRSLKFMVMCLFLIASVGMVGRVMWRQTLARTTHMAGRMLRLELWETLRFQSVRLFHRYPLGDLMNRAIGDLNAARFIYGFTIVLTFDLLFFTCFAIISMLFIHVQLTLVAMAILLFLPYPIMRLGRQEHDLHLKAQDRLSLLSDVIAQCLNTVRMQRATASESIWQARLKKEADLYARRRFKVLWTGWMIYPLGAFASVIAYVALLIYGVWLIGAGGLTIGQFVAMQSYIFLLQRPLFDLGECISEWQKGFASLQRIDEVIRLEKADQRNWGAHLARTSNVAIDLRNFSFRYPDAEGERALLNNINFTVNAGEYVGITGSIGSGKSTLLYVLAGLLFPCAGEAKLFGVGLQSANRSFFKENVTFVLQKTFLFAGTIRDNLQLDKKYSDAELWAVLRSVCLADEFAEFRDGLDTVIGEWGITLSGGQKQRLSLARAMLAPKGILLLDDCLSAVDAVTEEEILSNLRNRLGRTTVVWTAHRKSTLKLCERIYELERGGLKLLASSHAVNEPNAATRGITC